MAASLTDKITDVRNSARPDSTTATGTRAANGLTLACASLVGWPTASKVHFVTYQTDTNNDVIAGTQLDCYGIVSGNSITNFTVLDGTDGGNSIGDKVEMLPTAGWAQDLSDALMVSHNRDGSLADGAVDTADVLAANVVTTGKILDSNVTNAKLAGSITSSKIIGIDKSILTTDSNPYKFSAYMIGNYSSMTNSTLAVPFDTEQFDTNNNFDITTNKGRYTAPVAGFYYVSGALTAVITSHANTGYCCFLLKNGTAALTGNRHVNMYGGSYIVTSLVTGIIQLAANDYITISGEGPGGSWTVQGGPPGTAGSFFQGFLMCRT